MARKNALLAAPPHAVEQAIRQLGHRVRLARVRRSLTRAELAEKIGSGLRAVADAESGKPSASIATYVAMLWAMGLLSDFELLGDPARDVEGEALSRSRERTKAVRPRPADNDF